MQATKEKITEETFLSEIYKNAKMGADAIINLLPKVKDDSMRSVMTRQLDGYEKYASRAKDALMKRGGAAKGENLMTRAMVKTGIALNTMIDATSTHIAEMMIEGSNMGVTEMLKLLNHYEPEDACSDAIGLAEDVLAFEEHNLELLKRYL